MLHYVVTTRGQATIREYLATRGRRLAGRLRVLPYERLPFLATLPRGSYVFSDVERLTPAQAEQAAGVWQALSEQPGVRLLNHPTRSLRRYELLRALFECGDQDWGAYRVTERRVPRRWPVFLRDEHDHEGPISGLLEDAGALAREIVRLERAGQSRERLLVVEFCDVAGLDGVRRKYSAFRVGDRILPRHVIFGKDWVQKQIDAVTREQVAEELAYVRENPHRDALMERFERARIDFGRIDYGVRDGRIQVFEINTNPVLGTFRDACLPERGEVVAAVNPPLTEALAGLAVAPAHGRERIAPPGAGRLALLAGRLEPVAEALMHAVQLERFLVPTVRLLRRARPDWLKGRSR